jgi:hypothetical protein
MASNNVFIDMIYRTTGFDRDAARGIWRPRRDGDTGLQFMSPDYGNDRMRKVTKISDDAVVHGTDNDKKIIALTALQARVAQHRPGSSLGFKSYRHMDPRLNKMDENYDDRLKEILSISIPDFRLPYERRKDCCLKAIGPYSQELARPIMAKAAVADDALLHGGHYYPLPIRPLSAANLHPPSQTARRPGSPLDIALAERRRPSSSSRSEKPTQPLSRRHYIRPADEYPLPLPTKTLRSCGCPRTAKDSSMKDELKDPGLHAPRALVDEEDNIFLQIMSKADDDD